MAKRQWTKWTRILLGSLVLVGYSVTTSFGQGDEEDVPAAKTPARTIGNVFQRMFAPKEPTTSEPNSTSQRTERGFKPGAFQGGFIRQLKAMADPSPSSDLVVEKAPALTSPTAPPSMPQSPNQMARRAPREPFSNPAPPPMSSTKNPTSTSRDIYQDDPPSLVGTGVNTRGGVPGSRTSASGMDANEPPIVSSSQARSESIEIRSSAMPQNEVLSGEVASTSLSTRSKATTANAPVEETPRVSRKSVPAANASQSSRSTTAQSTPPGYSIPGNPYTSSSKSSSGAEANRYDGPRSSSVPAHPQGTAPGNPNTVAAVPPGTSAATLPSTPALPTAQPTTPGNQPVANASSMRGDTRLDMAIPKVKLFVSGPPSLQVGKSVPYEILVRNEGVEALSGVLVSMIVPPFVKTSMPGSMAGEYESEKDKDGYQTLLWNVAELGPSQSRIFRIALEATKAEHFAVDLEWTVLPQAGQVQILVQQPQLQIGLEGPSSVLWGKPELYRLRVRNPGNADVKDVQVRLTAETYGSNQSKIGDIPAGGEKIVEIELTFQQTGSIKLAGSASSETMELEANAAIDVAVEQIELATEWNGPDQQYQGSISDHTLKVTNRSQAAAENVKCTANIPSGLKVVSLPPGAQVHGSEIVWTVPRIDANATMNFSFALQALASGETKLDGAVECEGATRVSAELLVQVDSITDLKLTVSDPIAPAPVGQDVVYDLTIVNRGSKAATAVQLLAQFSHGIEPVRAEGSPSKLLPGQVVFEPIPVIEAGQEIVIRVVAKASEPGMHRFRAELQCEDGETQLVEEESTRYLATTRTESARDTIRR